MYKINVSFRFTGKYGRVVIDEEVEKTIKDACSPWQILKD